MDKISRVFEGHSKCSIEVRLKSHRNRGRPVFRVLFHLISTVHTLNVRWCPLNILRNLLFHPRWQRTQTIRENSLERIIRGKKGEEPGSDRWVRLMCWTKEFLAKVTDRKSVGNTGEVSTSKWDSGTR